MLRSHGVEEKMVTLLQKIYEITQLAVRIREMQGVWFPIHIGTRQEDPLSPLLFIVYLERAMDHLKESKCGININGIILNNLRYVNDIDLVDEECSSAEKQFEATRIAAEEAGLVMFIAKTKTMVFGDRNIEQTVQTAGTTIENVDKF